CGCGGVHDCLPLHLRHRRRHVHLFPILKMPAETTTPIAKPPPTPMLASPATAAPVETRFVNAMRLSARCWLLVAAIVFLVEMATPPVWKKIERFDTGPDYRLPYTLSRDYWLYERRLGQIPQTNIVVIGDSVIWG